MGALKHFASTDFAVHLSGVHYIKSQSLCYINKWMNPLMNRIENSFHQRPVVRYYIIYYFIHFPWQLSVCLP